jgi:hypothetical protein
MRLKSRIACFLLGRSRSAFFARTLRNVAEVGNFDEWRVEVLSLEPAELLAHLDLTRARKQREPFIISPPLGDHCGHRHLKVRDESEYQEPHWELVDITARDDALNARASKHQSMRHLDEQWDETLQRLIRRDQQPIVKVPHALTGRSRAEVAIP